VLCRGATGARSWRSTTALADRTTSVSVASCDRRTLVAFNNGTRRPNDDGGRCLVRPAHARGVLQRHSPTERLPVTVGQCLGDRAFCRATLLRCRALVERATSRTERLSTKGISPRDASRAGGSSPTERPCSNAITLSNVTSVVERLGAGALFEPTMSRTERPLEELQLAVRAAPAWMSIEIAHATRCRARIRGCDERPARWYRPRRRAADLSACWPGGRHTAARIATAGAMVTVRDGDPPISSASCPDGRNTTRACDCWRDGQPPSSPTWCQGGRGTAAPIAQTVGVRARSAPILVTRSVATRKRASRLHARRRRSHVSGRPLRRGGRGGRDDGSAHRDYWRDGHRSRRRAADRSGAVAAAATRPRASPTVGSATSRPRSPWPDRPRHGRAHRPNGRRPRRVGPDLRGQISRDTEARIATARAT
jgi:hypothetical protein